MMAVLFAILVLMAMALACYIAAWLLTLFGWLLGIYFRHQTWKEGRKVIDEKLKQKMK